MIQLIPVPPLPPKDGSYVKAYLSRPNTNILTEVALQFDPALGRWFTGKGHMVAEARIAAWEKTVLPSSTK